MSKHSAVIKNGFVNLKEYEDKIASNPKHLAVCKFCTNPLVILERKATTSAFVRHLQRYHKAK